MCKAFYCRSHYPTVSTTHSAQWSKPSERCKQVPATFYWYTTSRPLTSVDAIICTNKEIIFIQVTVGVVHDVKVEGLNDILHSLPKQFLCKCDLCLVFITDTEERAVGLQSQKLL